MSNSKPNNIYLNMWICHTVDKIVAVQFSKRSMKKQDFETFMLKVEENLREGSNTKYICVMMDNLPLGISHINEIGLKTQLNILRTVTRSPFLNPCENLHLIIKRSLRRL